MFISAQEKGSGIKITGSGDIINQDLPHGFVVPKNNKVVFDAQHKLLSGQDPTVLNEFITAIGERFKVIQMSKTGLTNNFPTVEQIRVSVRNRLDGIINSGASSSEFRYPGAAPSYPRGPFNLEKK